MNVALVIAWIAFFVTDVAVGQSGLPVISQHPTGNIHSPGDSVTLDCMTEALVNLIEWYRDGEMVGSGPRLELESFSEVQAGEYTCRATTHNVGTVTSAIARLQLAVFEVSPPGTPSAPSSLTVTVNQPQILDCGNITSIPPSTYSWRFRTFGNFAPPDNAIVGLNDGLLYLQLLTATPEEDFVCMAQNSYTQVSRSGYIRLTVEGDSSVVPASPRVMMSPPQDVVASEGETVFFHCIVGGSPVPRSDEIAWTYPNPTDSPLLSHNNAILTIRSVSTTDTGMYSCNVTDLGQFNATLTVLVTPVLSVSLGPPLTIIYGDPLSLSCAVDNTAVSEWRWYLNGVPHPNHITDEGVLAIETANTSYNGLYQCFAYNPAGNDSSTTSVTVMTIPATFTESLAPPNSLLFERSDISYRCVAHGAPPPKILWFHDERPLDTVLTSMDPETRETTSTLELTDVGVEDGGVYVCRAVNEVEGSEVGNQESKAILTVIAPTVITSPSEVQPTLTLELERPATLPCQATAQEGAVLQFTWEKDGDPLLYDSDRLSLTNGSRSTNITITSVTDDDAGLYQCVVVTMYEGIEGPRVKSIVINITATPELLIPPHLRPNIEVTATSFRVVWYYPGANAQAKLDSYAVSYREEGALDPIAEYTQPITAPTDYIISDSETTPVKPYTTYVVTVWANYKSGERVASMNVTVVTSEDVPGVPGEVMATVLNNTAILVAWMHPQERNGIITNYTLRYKQESSNNLYITVPLSSNATQYELTALLPRACYLVQVAASTAVGLGPYSESITVSTNLSDSDGHTPIYHKVWFIVVLFVLGLVVATGIVMAVCGVRLARKQRRKYTIESSMEMDKMNGRHAARSLTEDDMADYNGRGARRNGAESIGTGLEGLESESSMGEKYPYEPSLSTTVSHMSSQAPAYINPPPFHEAIRKLHSSRLNSAYSGSTLDRPPASTIGTESDWGLDSSSKTQFLDTSPSPPHSYRYTSPPPPPPPTSQRPPPPPPPPPPLPQSPTHSVHNYASLKDLDYGGARGERGEEERRVPASHPPTPNSMYDDNGYNRLPTRTPPPQLNTQSRSHTLQYMRRSSAQNMHSVARQSPLPTLAKTSSQPNFATFV